MFVWKHNNIYGCALCSGRATASPPLFSMEEHEPAPKIVPGAVTFQDRNAMMKVTAVSAVGTLAYIIEEQALLVRVNNGWQYIAVSVQICSL